MCSLSILILTIALPTLRVRAHHQADTEVKAASAEIDRLEEELKRDDLSEADRDALLVQLKAAKVRLALAEERRRRAAERKAALRAGNHLLHQKLQDALSSETVQEALVKEAEALLSKSVVDDSHEIDTEVAQVSSWLTHARTPARTQAQIHTRTHTRTHTRIHTRTHARTHARAITRLHTAASHAGSCLGLNACVLTCSLTHTHTRTPRQLNRLTLTSTSSPRRLRRWRKS